MSRGQIKPPKETPMSKSKIIWTEESWNNISGCTKCSLGCKRCYACIMTRRLRAMKQSKYAAGFDKVVVHRDWLRMPLERKKPTLYFVNSMSDTFHKDVPESFIRELFDVMDRCPQHTFQVLTKRSERLRQLAPRLVWPANIWQGVSVESSDYYGRIKDLLKTPAKVKFLSLEPLLSSVADIPLDGIDWVIVGGESGPGARPMEAGWAREVRDKCVKMNIPFFFKQWGGKGAENKKRGRLLDGRI